MTHKYNNYSFIIPDSSFWISYIFSPVFTLLANRLANLARLCQYAKFPACLSNMAWSLFPVSHTEIHTLSYNINANTKSGLLFLFSVEIYWFFYWLNYKLIHWANLASENNLEFA